MRWGDTYLYSLYKGVTPPGRFCYLIFGCLCYLKMKLEGQFIADFSLRSGPVLVVLIVNETLSFANFEVSFLDFSSTPKGFTPKKPRVKSQHPDTSRSMNNPYNCPFES